MLFFLVFGVVMLLPGVFFYSIGYSKPKSRQSDFYHWRIDKEKRL